MTLFFKAIYSDEKDFVFSLDENGADSYNKIDRTKLVQMEVWDDAKLLHKLHLEKGQRLILRTRVKKVMIKKVFLEMTEKEVALDDIPGNQIRVILIGYQETIKGENRQAITVIFPDGHTEHISHWKEAPMGFINLKAQEMESVR